MPRPLAHPAAQTPPWEIGRPQPAFRAVAEAGALNGRVLDIGCGTGEHALMAAQPGHDATGVDVDVAALAAARRKAVKRGLTARFFEHDACLLGDLGEHFGTVLDCGLLHVVTRTLRTSLVDNLRSVIPPGGRYFMLGGGRPYRLLSRNAFSRGWRIDVIEPATIDVNLQPPAFALCARPSPAPDRSHGTHPSQGDTMPSIEARITTERPNRYLNQLCQHATAMNSTSGHRLRRHSHSQGFEDPQLTVHAECTDDAGVLTFTPGDARCIINATPSLLTVRIDADEETTMTQVRDVITRDLQRFGRRDRLAIFWE